MILYDIDSDEIIHILRFDYDIESPSMPNSFTISRNEMTNISFDVGEAACDYIRDWYLETLKQTDGKLRYASEYKRDLYVTLTIERRGKCLAGSKSSLKEQERF